MKNFKRFACVALGLAMLSACATGRGVLDIEEKVVANPSQGTPVKFVRITDLRKFQINPPEADVPSLMNDEINNPAITSRAIARKRGGFGKALGDILLPEGDTVQGLVESSLTRGLRENGYSVLVAGDEGFEDAAPIEVDIEKFWGWFSPGFWSVGITFETMLSLSGPVGPFADGETLSSKVENRVQLADTGNWLETVNMSLDELNQDIAKHLSDYDSSKK